MTKGDFEDEESRRLAEEQKGRLRVTNPIRGMCFKDGGGELEKALEPHDFEGARLWTMEYLLDRVKNIFCANCIHRPDTQLTCERANCDTLDRLEGRLWKVEG